MSRLDTGRSYWQRSMDLRSLASMDPHLHHFLSRSRSLRPPKSRRNRLPIGGFSVCSSVTWSARPRYRRNSTRKTCTS